MELVLLFVQLLKLLEEKILPGSFIWKDNENSVIYIFFLKQLIPLSFFYFIKDNLKIKLKHVDLIYKTIMKSKKNSDSDYKAEDEGIFMLK